MTWEFEDYTVAICGVLYIMTAIGMAHNEKWGLAVAYVAYALANAGLIMTSMAQMK